MFVENLIGRNLVGRNLVGRNFVTNLPPSVTVPLRPGLHGAEWPPSPLVVGVNPNWSVQLFDNADDVLSQDFSRTKVLIIDNDFGVGRMSGSQAVQLIRNQARDADAMVIAFWTSDDGEEAPGADLIWQKNVSITSMAEDLNKALAESHVPGNISSVTDLV